jgi:hypothetical protein
MRVAARILAVVLVVYLGFVLYLYTLMRRPPEQFARSIAGLAAPAFLAAPFESLWTRARAGSLNAGDIAPDFDLQTVDRKARVRLSAFRGVKPVVLIFGSYT